MRGKAGRVQVRVDMQYVMRILCVSHIHSVTTKGDFPLEEMSIQGRCQNHSLSNAVASSWMLLAWLMSSWLYSYRIIIKTYSLSYLPPKKNQWDKIYCNTDPDIDQYRERMI